MELIKFRRQYLITSKEIAELDDWQKETFNGMNVYAEQSLQVHKRNVDDREFLLLGYWINPHFPEKNNSEIMDDMVAGCDTFESVLPFLYPLSGRFALFCKFREKIYGINDASGFKSIFYSYTNYGINISSNIKLMSVVEPLKEKDTLKKYCDSSYYFSSPTYAWPVGYCFFENVYQLVPNHYLDIIERKIVRFFPNQQLQKLTNKTDIELTIKETVSLLKNSINALCGRESVSLSITSGVDSRTLLALSRDNVDNIYFWISYNSRKESDYYLPQLILSDLGLKFHPIKNVRASRCFTKFYDEALILPHSIWRRYLGSMLNKYPDNMIVIRGASAETVENYYYQSQPHPDVVSIENLKHQNFGYIAEVPELRRQMESYLAEVNNVCRKYDYNVLDFVFWEQREGQWQAASQLESDFLFDVFVPFSNREILNMLLTIPNELRNKKNCHVYKRIIESNWPELLKYPFNPPSKYSRFELKMQYYKAAAKFKLKQIFRK
ncbi:MAG: hypothetical protein IKP45_08260 [Bacteroidales bacterium]|nr:hypothetical protein [Bacteroidales bacterium]